MNELEQSAVPEQAHGLPGAPSLLRQAREAAGLHIAALAAALKVPVKKLEALEAGRYHELHNLTFARGLAASACRHLKVDPAAVLEQIPGMVCPPLGVDRPPINAPFKPGDGSSAGGAMAWLSRPVVWGVCLLLLAAVAVAVLPQGWISRFQAQIAPATETPITTPGVVIESVVQSFSDDMPQASPQAVAPEAMSDAPMAPALEAAPLAAAEPIPTAVGSGLLSIRAVSESWIEVINGSGVQVVQRVLKPGDVLDFSSTPPYSVVVGRADAVQVTVRGQPLDVMPYARNSVARFEVK
jgi:cytoskeleton protein RodZ